MRRVELIRAVRKVMAALKESRVYEALAEAGRAPGDERAKLALLAALRNYAVLSASFGAAEKTTARALELHHLDDPVWWARVVGGGGDGSAGAAATAMATSIRFAGANLPRLLALLSTEGLRRRAADPAQPGDGKALLEVIVIESEDAERSNPVRLITALEGVWLLYDAAASMQKLPANTLSVAAMDSGSDKSFDFVGLAPAIKAVKDIVLSLWDRVVFYRGKQLEARFAMIERSLPVLERVAALRERGVIGPEEAEILRRKLLSGVKKFLEAGCTIPEIDDNEFERARALLAPSPKLLSNPDSPLRAAARAHAAAQQPAPRPAGA
jgi:hypothetical protein